MRYAALLSLLLLLSIGSIAQAPKLIVPNHHTRWVTNVALSPDERYLVSADFPFGTDIKVWDLRERRLVNQLSTTKTGVREIDFIEERTIQVAYLDGHLQKMDILAGKVGEPLKLVEGGLERVDHCSKEGYGISYFSPRKPRQLYRVNQGVPEVIFESNADVDWSLSRSWLSAQGDYWVYTLWDNQGEKSMDSILMLVHLPTEEEHQIDLPLKPDQIILTETDPPLLIANSVDRMERFKKDDQFFIFDLSNRTFIKTERVDMHIESMFFDESNSRLILTGSELRVYDTKLWKTSSQMSLAGNNNKIFQPVGQDSILVLQSDSSLKLLNAKDLSVLIEKRFDHSIRTYGLGLADGFLEGRILLSHNQTNTNVIGGTQFHSSGDHQELLIWDIQTDHVEMMHARLSTQLKSKKMSRDGSALLFSLRSKINELDIEKGRIKNLLGLDRTKVNDLEVTEKGLLIATTDDQLMQFQYGKLELLMNVVGKDLVFRGLDEQNSRLWMYEYASSKMIAIDLENKEELGRFKWEVAAGLVLSNPRTDHVIYVNNPAGWDMASSDPMPDTLAIIDITNGEMLSNSKDHPILAQAGKNHVAIDDNGNYQFLDRNGSLQIYSPIENRIIESKDLCPEVKGEIKIEPGNLDDQGRKKMVNCGRDSKVLYDLKSGEIERTWVRDTNVEPSKLEEENLIPTQYRMVADEQGEFLIGYVQWKNLFWEYDNDLAATKECDISGYIKSIDRESDHLLSTSGNKINLFRYSSCELLASMIVLDSANWVVTHPSGLFDASPGAMNMIYFVQNGEIIELDQLKERYWEPDLWAKAFAGEQIRDVQEMGELALYPELEVATEENQLQIELKERSGGIGEIAVFINGKQVVGDLRQGQELSGRGEAQLNLDLSEYESYFIPSEENTITVRAKNEEGWLVSRGASVSYQPEEKVLSAPNLYAVLIGVSDYEGDAIDLRYAAKDAHDMAAAIEMSASALLEIDNQERVFIYEMHTDNKDKKMHPSKTNIEATLSEIANEAKAEDIILLYMAGHGISNNQDGKFYYLSADAKSTELRDPSVRDRVAISTDEFAAWLTKIKAQKQVMILDACHSGKLAEDMLIAMRSGISAGQVRALERLKDRTGMYVLSGSAADQVSYETSRYDQGLLTYSLLMGIKGAALRQNEFVDVNQLFQFAADQVPTLAKGLGGVQRPVISAPRGGAGFDIGKVTDEIRNNIKLAQAKPIFVRAVFQDELSWSDPMNISGMVNAALGESAARGSESNLVYIDAEQYDDSYKLVGRYSLIDEKILLEARLMHKGKTLQTIKLEEQDAETLIAQLVESVRP